MTVKIVTLLLRCRYTTVSFISQLLFAKHFAKSIYEKRIMTRHLD